MSELKEIPPEVREKARVVIQIAQGTEAVHAVDILTPWVATDPDLFVQVMLTLALMSDPDNQLKEAHAAYARGDRTPIVVELERKYQRLRKQRDRRYAREREAAA